MRREIPCRTTIILAGPNDWDEWLEVVKTKAEAGKVWDYVDPSKPKDQLGVLSRPTVPMAKEVNPRLVFDRLLTPPGP